MSSKPLFADADPAHPLRPYYQPPPSDPTLFSSPSANAASPSRPISRVPPAATPKIPSRATRPPAGAGASTSSYAELEDETEGGDIIRSFLSSGLLGFTSTAMVMPFEVAKTLLQVQWVPRDEGYIDIPSAEARQREAELAASYRREEEDEDEAAYFTDLQARPMSASFLQHARPVPSAASTELAAGGMTRRSVYDDSAKPGHVLPVLVHGGVWEMMKLVGRSKQEGWLSLWKGTFTTYILDTLGTIIQPFLLSTFSLFLPTSHLPSIPLIHSPHPTPLLLLTTLSHSLTGLFLSPLDLLRTRLIVQSRSPSPHKYSSIPGSLTLIAHTEGGWMNAFYSHSTVFFPTLIDCTIRPLVHYFVPLVIERAWGIPSEESPILFGLAELVLNTAGMLVTLPIETVRRRLQVQSRAADEEELIGVREDGAMMGSALNGGGVKTCVEIRRRKYVGVVDTVWSILTEEKTGTRAGKRKTDRGRGPTWEGLRQLYRGFGMGFTANVIVFGLGVVVGKESRQSPGWAEI